MDKFDCNIIVVFVLGVLNRGDHMAPKTNITMILQSNLSMWSPLLSTPKTNITMILQSNLSMWSPLLSQTCPCGHLTVISLLCLF
jgi:hypothetical protein